MALLAEQLVDEWLNRQGFFTLRGIKEGVQEIDLLGIRAANGLLEAWHVEVQVSFRPVGYISKLSKEAQLETGAKSGSSAKSRSSSILKTSVEQWVDSKFNSKSKTLMREKCWKNVVWIKKFVYGVVREQIELDFIEAAGIEIIPFQKILKELCGHRAGEMFGGAGTDIAEVIRYYDAAL